jgi:hypothetical protein
MKLLLGLSFIGAFEMLGKATISFVMSVHQSARNNSARTSSIFTKFCVFIIFDNLSRKFKFHSNMTRIMSSLHKNVCTLMTTPRLNLLER